MPKNTSITLGEHFADFIEDQVAAGRYGSASEVVRAGLRLLEEHEARVGALRAALIAGEESGVSARTVDEIFDAAKARHDARNG
jgi:antitoxin ParD1/3/4